MICYLLKQELKLYSDNYNKFTTHFLKYYFLDKRRWIVLWYFAAQNPYLNQNNLYHYQLPHIRYYCLSLIIIWLTVLIKLLIPDTRTVFVWAWIPDTRTVFVWAWIGQCLYNLSCHWTPSCSWKFCITMSQPSQVQCVLAMIMIFIKSSHKTYWVGLLHTHHYQCSQSWLSLVPWLQCIIFTEAPC